MLSTIAFGGQQPLKIEVELHPAGNALAWPVDMGAPGCVTVGENREDGVNPSRTRRRNRQGLTPNCHCVPASLEPMTREGGTAR